GAEQRRVDFSDLDFQMLAMRLPVEPSAERAGGQGGRKGNAGERRQHHDGDQEQTFSWHRVVIALNANNQRAKQLYFGAMGVRVSAGVALVNTSRIGCRAWIRLLSCCCNSCSASAGKSISTACFRAISGN